MSLDTKNIILVVDDDPKNIEVILQFLEEKPDEVIYAPNGQKGCELAESENPDLIIMDWEMPVMDGIEATKWLKSHHATKNIPIIMATGVMTESKNLQTAMDAGAIDFIRKPFDRIEFNARVRSILRINEQNQQIKELLESEKQLLSQTVEHKQRELTAAAMYDHQKSELLQKLVEELRRLDSITNSLYTSEIKEIRRQIDTYLDLEKSWKNFKLHFEDVHPGFFDKLSHEFEELSPNERRVCAYLKIGLDNNEIAQLTNVAGSSVRKALNRLKKKLDLGPSDDLRNFILNY